MDTEDVISLNCTENDLRIALHRSLSVHHFPLPMRNEKDAPTDVIYVSKQ